MFALGIPKTQYRRTHDVLGHSKSDPINYYDEKQDDGFYMFYFPEMDEDNFSHVVKTLKNNGVTTIGADDQLTEKNIMKLTNLINLEEQNTTAGEFNVDVSVQNEMEKVNIKYGHATGPVDDVTISWGNESHNVDFEAEDVIDDHGNEGKDMTFVAYSEDDKWRFIVDVSVGFNYEDSGEIQEVMWDTLEIDIDDTKKDNQAEPKALNERFQQLAGIKPLYEQGFDDRLKSAMGMSDDEFEDKVASRDIGSPFPGTDNKSSEGKALADRTIEHLRREHYRNMSDKDLDEFSAAMVEHFLDNIAAQARAKIVLSKKGI